jgi:hypothetical protein
MKKALTIAIMAMLIAAFTAGTAMAHTPLFACWDNGDGTLSCEAGFSDGSSAAKMPVKVTDENGKVISECKLDSNGEATFKKPTVKNYTITFDGGPGHSIKIPSKDIQ